LIVALRTGHSDRYVVALNDITLIIFAIVTFIEGESMQVLWQFPAGGGVPVIWGAKKYLQKHICKKIHLLFSYVSQLIVQNDVPNSIFRDTFGRVSLSVITSGKSLAFPQE
jgi:hypothetical protein